MKKKVFLVLLVIVALVANLLIVAGCGDSGRGCGTSAWVCNSVDNCGKSSCRAVYASVNTFCTC
jgi:hypothetical protein